MSEQDEEMPASEAQTASLVQPVQKRGGYQPRNKGPAPTRPPAGPAACPHDNADMIGRTINEEDPRGDPVYRCLDCGETYVVARRVRCAAPPVPEEQP